MWLKRRAGDEAEKEERPRKKRRCKSYEMLCSMQNALSQTCGFGLEKFVVRADSDLFQRPFDWPSASCACDQGPDMVCGLNFAQYQKQLNLDSCWDLSHGCWNDTRKALKSTSMWPHVLLTIVAYNVPYGTTFTPSRLKQMREAVKEYQQLASPDTCPVFLHFLPLIMEDRGMPASAAEEGWVEELWESLPDADLLWKKGDKVGLARFFAVIYKNRSESTQWNLRALCLTYICLQLGYLSNKRGADLVTTKDKAEGASAAEETRTSVKAGQAEIGRLRRATANNMHIAALVFADRSYQFKERLIRVVVDSWTCWHSEQNSFLRNLENTVLWEIKQLKGGMMEPGRVTFQVLADHAQLLHCGMQVAFTCLPSADDQLHDLEWNDDQADTMGSFALALTGARITRLMSFSRGWPRRSVLILDEELAEVTLAACRRDYETFMELKDLRQGWADKLVRRSPFNTRPCQQFVFAAQSEGWRPTERLKKLVKEKSTRIVVSQLIEDGFNRGRRSAPELHMGHNFELRFLCQRCARTWLVQLLRVVWSRLLQQ